MGRRGPPPKPTVIKLLQGNPGKRKLNRNEPKPDSTKPECPDWLKPKAKIAWRRLVRQLSKMGVLAASDRDALAAYCQTYARWQETEEYLDMRWSSSGPIRRSSCEINTHTSSEKRRRLSTCEATTSSTCVALQTCWRTPTRSITMGISTIR